MYKAVLFDFDYTLGNSEEGIILSANVALQAMGHPAADRDAIRRTIGLALPCTYTALTGDTDEKNAAQFTALFIQHADTLMADHTRWYDGVPSMLAALKHRAIAVGIVTTKNVSRMREIVRKYALDPLFDLIVGGDSVKSKKPAPDGVLLALSQLQLKKDEVLYVGDSVVDARTATAAGVPFCAVLTGTTSADELSPYAPLYIANTAVEGCEHLILGKDAAGAENASPFCTMSADKIDSISKGSHGSPSKKS